MPADPEPQPEGEPSEPASRFGGFTLNDRDSDPFPRAVGALLANFGSVEMFSHVWLTGVSTDSLLAKELERTPFSKRVAIIVALAEAGRIPAQHLAAVKSVWSRARQLSELRNQVAHNPVILGWNGTKTEGPPHILGVVDRRKSAITSTIGLAEINSAVDASAALAQEIHKLGQVIEGEKAWPFQKAGRDSAAAS